MTPQITLYQFAGDPHIDSDSPFCLKVHRALGLKKLEYIRKNVPFSAVKKLNPAGKLPVLDIGDRRIADSSAILAAIDELAPEPPLWPASPGRDRARAHVLEDWADESLNDFANYSRWQIDANFARFSKRMVRKLSPPLKWILPGVARRNALAQLSGRGLGRHSEADMWVRFEAHLDELVAWLGDDDFFSGAESPNAADIGVFAQLRVMAHPEQPDARARLTARPALWAWLSRVDAATQTAHTKPLPEG